MKKYGGRQNSGKNRFANNLASAAEKTERTSMRYTDNGALAYKFTNSKLVDLNFQVPKLRTMPESEMASLWRAAYKEDPALALRWLFFLRDVRGGLGERDAFRKFMRRLSPNLVVEFIKSKINGEYLIPFYGRWDDVFSLWDMAPEVNKAILYVMKQQLQTDIIAMKNNNPITLMAKWAPSPNNSNKDRKIIAGKLAKGLGMTPILYRRTLSSLKEYMKLPEKLISSNRWDEVQYAAVPSGAMRLYQKAFLRHSHERFEKYIADVKAGKSKINAAISYPYEILMKTYQILSKYGYSYGKDYCLNRIDGLYYSPAEDLQKITEDDQTLLNLLDEMWKRIPGFTGEAPLVFLDGSISMLNTPMKLYNHGNNIPFAMIAASLAIKSAEMMHGAFHNRFMTFGRDPHWVDLDGCETIVDKMIETFRHNDWMNTNLEKSLLLILDTAKKSHASQEDLPKEVCIMSDMQFDEADRSVGANYKTLFDNIKQQFHDAGYQMPKVTFWNIAEDNPVPTQDPTVNLVSGYSLNAYVLITTEAKSMLEAIRIGLCVPRYDRIEEIFRSNKDGWSYRPDRQNKDNKFNLPNSRNPKKGNGHAPFKKPPMPKKRKPIDKNQAAASAALRALSKT